MFKKYRENKVVKQSIKDRQDLTVHKVKTTFKTVLSDEISYLSYCPLHKLKDGLYSFMEIEMLNNVIFVRGIAYNTKNIVSLKSDVICEKMVKKEIRDSNPLKFENRRFFSPDELEEKTDE